MELETREMLFIECFQRLVLISSRVNEIALKSDCFGRLLNKQKNWINFLTFAKNVKATLLG